MGKIISVLLCIISFSAIGQSIERLDSLLKVPGLYLIGLPGDGPKEALNGLKPVFCNDVKIISNFFKLLKEKKDTSIDGNAYCNYAIQVRSDSTGLNEILGFTFNPKDLSYANMEIEEEFYSFNIDAISYLKANSIKLREVKFRVNKKSDIRKFNDYLLNTKYTIFYGSEYLDSTYLMYDGYITIQLECPREIEYIERFQLIKNKINSIVKEKDYYLIERVTDFADSTKVTKTIEVHTNKENLGQLYGIVIIEDWKNYEELEFSVYSYYIKDIMFYYY